MRQARLPPLLSFEDLQERVCVMCERPPNTQAPRMSIVYTPWSVIKRMFTYYARLHVPAVYYIRSYIGVERPFFCVRFLHNAPRHSNPNNADRRSLQADSLERVAGTMRTIQGVCGVGHQRRRADKRQSPTRGGARDTIYAFLVRKEPACMRLRYAEISQIVLVPTKPKKRGTHTARARRTYGFSVRNRRHKHQHARTHARTQAHIIEHKFMASELYIYRLIARVQQQQQPKRTLAIFLRAQCCALDDRPKRRRIGKFVFARKKVPLYVHATNVRAFAPCIVLRARCVHACGRRISGATYLCVCTRVGVQAYSVPTKHIQYF